MKMAHVLFGTLATVATVAFVRSFSGAPAPEPEPVAAEAAPQGASPTKPPRAGGERGAAAQGSSSGIRGEVLEVIEVPGYSYLRVGARGSDGTWVAVPTAGLSAGATVSVASPMKMVDFKSAALGRTFPVIYFGSLDAGSVARGPAAPAGDSPHGASPDPHAGLSPHGGDIADPHGGGASPHGDADDPHGGIRPSSAAPVDVKPVPRAEGENGKTVAEVIGQRTALEGKAVRLRGTVVKVNAGILGRTYLHVRDGSGDASAGTNDIVVTTLATPSLGDTVIVEGQVVLDRDIGSGYRFSTMIEDAKLEGP